MEIKMVGICFFELKSELNIYTRQQLFKYHKTDFAGYLPDGEDKLN
jgi:hypothetical protein